MAVVWKEDPSWSPVYSYALEVNGEVVGRVFQAKTTGEWRGFLHGTSLRSISDDGTLAGAKKVTLEAWKRREGRWDAK